MRKFKVQKQIKNVRPNYKTLRDVKDLGIESYSTINSLKEEFLLTPLQITEYLRDEEIWPVGKIPKRDPETQKPARGKPALAFDPKEAHDAIRTCLERKAKCLTL